MNITTRELRKFQPVNPDSYRQQTGKKKRGSKPCIVVRGQDKLALHVIDGYIAMYQSTATTVDEDVVHELRQHRDAIEQWQTEHPPKFADR